MTLLELFVNCVYNIIYEQVGDSVNYAFVEQDHTLYIYFEGSNSITDWVLNFWFTKFETPRCIKVKKELKYYWGGLTTIRTNNDLITHLPPRLFGFTDLGTMVKTKGDTSLVDNHFPKCIKSHYPQVVISGLKEKNI